MDTENNAPYPMKLYKGFRSDGMPARVRVVIDGPDHARTERDLDARLDLRRHSPDGFSWGYLGSGPAQLSLAILCDALGDDQRALFLYQDFKLEMISKINGDEWTIAASTVIEWGWSVIAEQRRQEAMETAVRS